MADSAGAARPSRSALSLAALRRRSSLSASIFALILCLAAISSCFSRFFAAASLSCSIQTAKLVTLSPKFLVALRGSRCSCELAGVARNTSSVSLTTMKKTHGLKYTYPFS